MFTIRTSAEITADRQIVLSLPPDTPLGNAEVVVTIAPAVDLATKGCLRERFGTAHGRDPRAADNERLDADLARSYEALGE